MANAGRRADSDLEELVYLVDGPADIELAAGDGRLAVTIGSRRADSDLEELVYLVDGPADIELAAGDGRLAVTIRRTLSTNTVHTRDPPRTDAG